MYSKTDKGEKLKKQVTVGKETLMPYVPSEKLITAVNYAIILKRPLLLKGEPGCGKTLLAKSVAYELGAYPNRYFEWRVKSTSKAVEGLYTFDYLRRLHDVQVGGKKEIPLTKYLNFGELGKAFKAAAKEPAKPVILLIDEIDKADIDFPNDLLHELEQKNFTIPELSEEEYPNDYKVSVPAANNLIIFITSNNEKELPDAFLRRCLFHYIEFPDNDLMKKIVAAHHPKLETELTQKMIEYFYDVRNKYQQNLPHDKKPSTSELLDWCRLMSQFADETQKEKLLSDFSILLKTENAVKTIAPPDMQQP